MNPSLAPQIVQQFVPNFNKCSKILTKYFESLKDEEEHAVYAKLKQEILQMAVGKFSIYKLYYCLLRNGKVS